MVKLLVRGIIGVLIAVLIAVAYAVVDALLSGTSVAEKLSNPIFWVVTGVCAAITGLVVMDKGSDAPREVKSRDRIAGEQLLWAIGAVLVIGILIGLVTRTPVLAVMASPAFWIPAGFAIVGAGLEPYRGAKKDAKQAEVEPDDAAGGAAPTTPE